MCSRLRPTLPFVSWNQEGWKTGLCSVPPVGHSHSLLALANNTCVKRTFLELRERFTKLYRKKVRPDSQPDSQPDSRGGQVVRRRCDHVTTGSDGGWGCLFQAHLHHYLQVDGMEQGCFTEAVASLSALIEEYSQLDATKGQLTPDTPRLNMAS